MAENHSRRSLLKTGLVASGIGLAGCFGDDTDPEDATGDANDEVDNGTQQDTSDDKTEADQDDEHETPPAEPVRFVVITDGHWGHDPSADRQTHAQAREQIESLHAERSIDFLVANGDIVDDGVRFHEQLIDEFFQTLPSEIEWYPTFGNHDWAPDAAWESAYGHPKQHTFEIGSYGGILCETGLVRDPGHGPEADADPDFIEEAIDEFQAQGKAAVFGFQHIPPYPIAGGNDMPAVRDQWRRDIVEGVFCGHNHRNNRPFRVDDQTYFQSELIGNRFVGVERGFRIVDIAEGTLRTRQVSLNGDTLNECVISDVGYCGLG